MKFRLPNVITFIGLALSVPTAIYAIAPVEDASQDTQGVQTGQLVPDADASQSTATDGAPVSQSAPSQDQSTATDNNPLIAPANTSPTLQNPTIGGNDNSALSSLPLSARVTRLEQQMQNIVRANVPSQVSSLQQQIQQLSGELQVQQHDIKLLNQQMRNFYQDLSNQIKQLKNMSSSDDSNSGPPAHNSSSQLPNAQEVAPTGPAKKKVTTGAKTPVNEFQVAASDRYKAALNALMKNKLDVAEKGFNNYINDYPDGHFILNAHYWLGEIYVQKRSLSSALKQFTIVIKKFPNSSKVADAKVKIGIIHAALGDTAKARVEFRKVQQQYPGTTAAQLAAIQLQQLGRS